MRTTRLALVVESTRMCLLHEQTTHSDNTPPSGGKINFHRRFVGRTGESERFGPTVRS